ncbi:MAG: hypothetical protein IKA13_04685 [Bacteroidales bacterium]|nr:hypothetical protein [Bacteroidales bacterium]
METEKLIIDSLMRDQICEEQIPYILDSYSKMKDALSDRYSSDFVENHPEVVANLTVALETKMLGFVIGELLENQTSGIIENQHHLLDKQ